MTPEMQKKREDGAMGARVFYEKGEEPEAYNTMMLYEVNDEREAAFVDGFTAAHDLMQEKVKALVEALRFYADDAQYNANDIVDGVEVMEISNDQGERAREALKGWE